MTKVYYWKKIGHKFNLDAAEAEKKEPERANRILSLLEEGDKHTIQFWERDGAVANLDFPTSHINHWRRGSLISLSLPFRKWFLRQEIVVGFRTSTRWPCSERMGRWLYENHKCVRVVPVAFIVSKLPELLGDSDNPKYYLENRLRIQKVFKLLGIGIQYIQVQNKC